MAYYNGGAAEVFYNGKILLFPAHVTLPTGGSAEAVDGHLITADGLYFMTADNQEFITKENTNG